MFSRQNENKKIIKFFFYFTFIINIFIIVFNTKGIGSENSISLKNNKEDKISVNLTDIVFHRLNKWFALSLIHQWKNIFHC